MKINWKVRIRNKVFLLPFLLAIATTGYQFLELLGIKSLIPEDQVAQVITILINILVMMGIVIDPTTPGIRDSEQAMKYKEPR